MYTAAAIIFGVHDVSLPTQVPAYDAGTFWFQFDESDPIMSPTNSVEHNFKDGGIHDVTVWIEPPENFVPRDQWKMLFASLFVDNSKGVYLHRWQATSTCMKQIIHILRCQTVLSTFPMHWPKLSQTSACMECSHQHF
jgi:hypothetical protein